MTRKPGIAPEIRTAAGDALTDLVLATFQLNGRFLEAAETMARPVGLTAAWWQVLGAVLAQPATVSTIAREMGLARQGVQRIADVLVEQHFAEYLPNPAHRRASLLQPTDAGRDALANLADHQHRWANQTAAKVSETELRRALRTIHRLIDSLEANAPPQT